MKKLVLFFTLFSGLIGRAQEEPVPLTDGNLVKLNALALTTGTISVQYERLVTQKSAVGISVNFMSKRKIPFLENAESYIDDPSTFNQLKNSRVSTFSITPEYRFYLGKDAFKGFYIAPFFRYASHKAEFPVTYYYQGEEQSVTIDGKLNAFSAGIAFGAQWKLTDKLYLDWLIMGPMYGSAKGNLSGVTELTDDEVGEVNDALRDLDIPMIDYEYQVNNNGVRVNLKGPWAGIRTAIGIGYRF